MLEVKGLQLRLGEMRWRYDFSLKRGQILALLGPSGVGKSTLLECLGGFITAEAGEILFDRAPLNLLPPQERPVATLFQQHNLFEHLSVADNLRLGFARARPDRVQWQRVQAACAALGVGELLARQPAALSGGQRQRVGLIRTVLRDVPLILLDEPFSALDASTRQVAGDWLRREIDRGDKLAIMVSHDDEDVARWTDARLTVVPLEA